MYEWIKMCQAPTPSGGQNSPEPPPTARLPHAQGAGLLGARGATMVRKKVDDRVRALIENGVKTHHRSLLVLVGDHGEYSWVVRPPLLRSSVAIRGADLWRPAGKDQVVNLHYILSRTQVKARPSVLWCYKRELGFSTHKKKVRPLINKRAGPRRGW
jgi:hypothetical protein